MDFVALVIHVVLVVVVLAWEKPLRRLLRIPGIVEI